jgi:hypothetical protein
MLSQREVVQEWTRVEDYPVDRKEVRTFEYRVVSISDTPRRTVLTIKLYRGGDCTIRLDPSEVSAGGNADTYTRFAERRVRYLYDCGKI